MYQRSSKLYRKNQIIINLIQTPAGYSVIEGQDLINKSSSITTLLVPTKQKPSHQTAKRQAIVNPIYPYVNTKKIEQQNKYTTIPSCASWFSINSVHEIERKSLSQWFKNKKSIGSKTEKYEKNEQLYKKYRNHILQLSKQGYLSATRARKGLAGDACSIMRIHAFLQHWGIINYIYKVYPQRELISKFTQQQKADIFDYDKKLISKTYNNQDTETLRICTKNYRPKCHFCRQRAGIVWFQYKKVNINKGGKSYLQNQQKGGQNLQNHIPINNQKFIQIPQYEIKLCTKCYLENNFPLILTPNDFNKVTIQDVLIQAKRKNKIDKQIKDFEWTHYQTNQLIQLLHKYGYNWKSIAKDLKNRTPEETIQHFLSLPLKQSARLRLSEPQSSAAEQQNTEQFNEISTNVGQTVINQEVFHKVAKKTQNQNPKVYYDEQQQKKQRQLYDDVLKLYLKKIEIKLDQLQEWENSFSKTKKQVEEGRKLVIAQKIRGTYK